MAVVPAQTVESRCAGRAGRAGRSFEAVLTRLAVMPIMPIFSRAPTQRVQAGHTVLARVTARSGNPADTRLALQPRVALVPTAARQTSLTSDAWRPRQPYEAVRCVVASGPRFAAKAWKS